MCCIKPPVRHSVLVALPKMAEETAPGFAHDPASTLLQVGDRFEAGRMLVFRAGDQLALRAGPQLLGGAAMDGPRHTFWNFVSSNHERIEQAKADWAAGRFRKVSGDAGEYITIPQ
jgi:hypothetical protein